jgi:hypothetical protein
MKHQKAVGTAVLALFTVTAAFADATVDTKTKVQFGGALGGVLNTIGGKSTREGIESTTVLKGDRKLTRTGNTGELVDLAEEKVYTIDFGRQTYRVQTFAEIRKQLEDAMKNAEEESSDDDGRGKGKNEGPEYVVDFDVKETKKVETINGFNTKQVIMTVTVREKGKKLEQSGGSVLTADMWMAGKVTAMKEVADFDARYYKKLYGGLLSGAEMQQMAALMAASPTIGKAMKTFGEKRGTLDGTPIRTVLRFETVAGSEQKAQSASSDQDAGASAAAALGGLLGRAMKKRSEPAESQEAATPGRNKVFESTSDTLRATATADASAVAIPAGFKQKK